MTCAVLVALLSSRAQAAESTVVDAPCDARALEARIEELVDVAPGAVAPQARVVVRAGEAGAYTLVVSLSGGGIVGEITRTLPGESCEQLLEAAAVIVAVHLRAAHEERAQISGASASDAGESPPLEVADPFRAPPASAGPPADPLRLEIFGGVGVDFGTFSRATPTVFMGRSFRRGAYRLEVGARAYLPFEAQEVEGFEVRASLVVAGLSGCAAPHRYLELCVGLDLGRVRAVGAASIGGEPYLPYAGGRFGVRAPIPLGGLLLLDLRLFASAPFAEYAVRLPSQLAVDRLGPIGGELGAGLAVQIP